ncbi:MAG: anti-sigma factor antagonist [Clostridiales bacterium]|nr:anti-sigma factor antagonist [Clostridiales bacterium]
MFLNISGDYREGKLTIVLSGELDHHAARRAMREIETQIDTYLPRECVLDFIKLQFMDSSGIALILKTYKRMKEVEGNLSVKNVPPQPMRVLDASGILRLIKIREAGK